MNGANDLGKLVPGFEFMQNLMKGASAGIPGMSQWIAPTLDPAELEKRIQELKTVQFWLDQNARLLGTTIQALEVQRMTLSTLQTMNLPMADLREALMARPSAAAAPPARAPAASTSSPWRMPPPVAPPPARAAAPAEEAEPKAAPAAVDPMQWWGALTQQFAEIATRAVADTAAAARSAAPDAAAPGSSATAATEPKTGARPAARKRGFGTDADGSTDAASGAAGGKAGGS